MNSLILLNPNETSSSTADQSDALTFERRRIVETLNYLESMANLCESQIKLAVAVIELCSCLYLEVLTEFGDCTRLPKLGKNKNSIIESRLVYPRI